MEIKGLYIEYGSMIGKEKITYVYASIDVVDESDWLMCIYPYSTLRKASHKRNKFRIFTKLSQRYCVEIVDRSNIALVDQHWYMHSHEEAFKQLHFTFPNYIWK